MAKDLFQINSQILKNLFYDTQNFSTDEEEYVYDIEF